MRPSPSSSVLTDLLYTQAKEFFGIYDPVQGWFTQVNPAGVRLLGYPSEDVFLADPDHSLRKPPWSAVQWQDLCEQARREGHQAVEAEIRRHTGEAFSAYLELTYFEDGDQPFFLIHISKQSRLQQAERELAHSVRRFEAVFTNATIGIIVCNRAGDIVSANELAGQQFGYPPAELLGRRIEVLVPNAAGRHHQQLRESFNAHPQVRGMGHNRVLRGQRQDGTDFPVEVSLSYFHLDEELYVVAYVLDITAKHNAELELSAQQERVARLNADLEQKVADRTHALMNTLEQLEQRSRELTTALAAEQELGEMKSRFVSMASHEFRTPLTGVLTSAELIADYAQGPQKDKQLKHVDRIRSSVKQLNNILEEFLSVGRIEEGRVEATPATLNMEALLGETVADVQALLKTGQRIECAAECAGLIRLDASLLRKILVNLLSNAIKYSGENTIVHVRATCHNRQLTLSVEDQGVGISQEDQEHLFERFFRARNVSTVPGTGLGLYIIAKYLELMGGTIALRSTLDVGTTVTITIPYENHSAD
ncbi:sensor histidine kinase [Hymenobacter arizonensis]|uniref:histidine kinase n=1 Tax=Hymenobacter arizonensis TaxID=1227077 RepID=A0A1I5U2F5_HYMAR|nr:PAS domain-containing sensor histidine kinase [Hymenobacter arizonensis]SFP89464.1 PAS domain S-box-containing protein [Hymenobacter arizonensis]